MLNADPRTDEANPHPRPRAARPMTRRLAALATAAALLAIAMIPMLPAVLVGCLPGTHEASRYDVLTMLFRDALAGGTLYPRWLPDLAGGRGYPTFLFYQPVFFYVAAACSLVPGLPSAAWSYVASGLFACIGATGAYALARPIVRSRDVSLAVAALFMLTPYLFVNLYVRGDHSEAAAMMLGPWPIALLLAIERRRRAGRPAFALGVAAAIAIAAILATHPAYALIYVPIVAAIATTRAAAFAGRAARARWLATLASIFVAAATIASPHWSSVVQHAPFVHLDRALAAEYRPEVNLFPLSRLLSSAWGFGRVDAPVTATSAPLSVSLGLPLFALAVVGAWVGRRRPWVVPAAVACATLVVAMTPLAAPFWSLPLNPLRRIQFPWRLLAVVATLQLPLLCHALPRGRMAAPIAWAAVVATFLASQAMFQVAPAAGIAADGSHRVFSWADGSAAFEMTRRALPANGYVFAAAREFDPIWSRQTPSPRGDAPIVQIDATVRPRAGHSDAHIDVSIDAAAPTRATIGQFYFPGWRVELNGAEIPDATLRAAASDEGLITLAVPAGTSRLVAYYDGPRFWRARSACAILIAIACAMLLYRQDRPTIVGVEPPRVRRIATELRGRFAIWQRVPRERATT